jgi:hypothetical protein
MCAEKNESEGQTHPFHNVQPPKGTHEVNRPQDNLRNITIADANTHEDSRAVVEKVVRARELLEALQAHPQERAIQQFMFRLEAIDPPARLSAFLLDLLCDLVDFGLYEAVRAFVFRTDSVGAGYRAFGFLQSAVCGQPASCCLLEGLNECGGR